MDAARSESVIPRPVGRDAALPSLDRLRWYTFLVPAGAASLILISEGFADLYLHTHDFLHIGVHTLLAAIFTAGLYVFSRHIFRVVRRSEEAILDQGRAVATAERRFRSLVEHSADGIAVLSASGAVRYLSPAVTRILGYEPAEVLGRRPFGLFHPEDRRMARERFRSLGRPGADRESFTLRLQHRDGSWRWIAATASNLLAEPGVRGFVVNYRDITARKKVEETLQAANLRLRDVLGSMSDVYYALDRNWRLLEINTVAEERIFRRPATEIMGKVIWDLYPEAIQTPCHDQYRAALAEGRARHFEGRCPISRIWIETHAYPREGRLDVYARDITQRRVAEEEQERLLAKVAQERERAEALAQALQAERDLLDTIMENTRTHLAYLDPDFRFVRVNSTYAESCRRSRESLLGQNHFALYPHPENEAIFARARDSGQSVEFRAKPFEFPDQPERGVTYWDWTLTPVKNSAGLVQGLVFSLMDVTEDVRAHQQIAALAFRDEAILASMSEGLVILGLDGRVLHLNPAALKIFGFASSAEAERPLLEFQPTFAVFDLEGRPVAAADRPAARVLRGETLTGFELEVKRLDISRRLILSYNGTLARGTDGQPLLGVMTFRDVTAQKAGERALAERARLAMLAAEVGQAFTQSDDLVLNLDRCADAMIRHLDASLARVWTLDEERQVLDLRASAGLSTRLDGAHGCIPVGRGMVGQVAANRQPYASNAVIGDPMILDQAWAARECIVACAAAPLLAGDRLMGVVAVFARHPFSEAALQAIGPIANEMALNIERERSQEALQRANDELEQRVQARTEELARTNAALVVEIAERRRAEGALRSLFDNVPVGLFRTAPTGQILDANPATVRMLGHPDRASLLATPTPTLYADPQDRLHLAAELESCGMAKEFHTRMKRRDGRIIWVRIQARTLLDAGRRTICYEGAIEDVTEHREADEKLRRSQEELRALAAHLQSVREEERARIAREIHDELGQALTGMKIDLAWISKRLPADSPAVEKVHGIVGLVDGTIRSVRRLATELRPGVLDDLGLVAAIEWQAREFQARTGTPCGVAIEGGEPTLDREQSTALFRILQETLTNVTRHARASRVAVTLARDCDQISLTVQDNGCGICGAERPGHQSSFGLVGMRERALLLGGEFHISGGPGEGTTIRVVIPLARPAGTPFEVTP